MEATNNRMELLAAIMALKEIRRAEYVRVVLYSDSAYLINCYTEGWMARWIEQGWRGARAKKVANRDLWETLDKEVRRFDGRIEWVHVRGHTGEVMNERADALAREARLAGIESVRRPAERHGGGLNGKGS